MNYIIRQARKNEYVLLESHDSKIFTKKLLSKLPPWYNEGSFLYVENA